MAVGVPADLASMDAAWLEAALREHGLDVAVDAVDVQPIAVGEGFIGLLARVVPTYGRAVGGAPSSLIAKLPSPDPGAQMIGQALRLWERECRFYRELAPTVDVAVPGCVLAEEDAADGRVVLLLEDLAGLETSDQLTGTSRERADAAIDWLAALHSSAWGAAEDPAFLPWIPRPDDVIYASLQPMAAAGFDTFASTMSDLVTADRRRLVERSIELVPELLQNHTTPFTIGHGDFRLDNMFFRPSGELVVFDWQLLLVSTYAYDLTYFLVTSLTVEQRDAWEPALLERYRNRLRDLADADLTADVMLESHRITTQFICGVLPVTLGSIDFDVNPRARALANAIVERVFRAADDLGITA